MKLLHTSDWHIGRLLYGRKRYDEFEAFLNWLAELIQRNEIDALLVAGDIFDTSTPSNRAQELYYSFLCRVAASSCRHVVLIAGNHDSPSFLSAPKTLLKTLAVHVVGSASEFPEDEVLVLRNGQDIPELIVCAVPYLRDKDIRTVEAGETVEDKEQKLIQGIRKHYATVATIAKERKDELGVDVPIVGMGHLFTAGGKTVDGDGVRELYVGSLAHVTAGSFPQCFNYLALGHLHVPQKVNDSDFIRYSGSPLPMGFGEAKQQKSICRVEFNQTEARVHLVDVPVFQKLERVQGDWSSISSRLLELGAAETGTWIEVVYDGDEVIGVLRERLDAIITNTQMEILRIKNSRIVNRVLCQDFEDESLDSLSVKDVFQRCLDLNEVPEEQREQLLDTYQEILSSIYEEDTNAE